GQDRLPRTTVGPARAARPAIQSAPFQQDTRRVTGSPYGTGIAQVTLKPTPHLGAPAVRTVTRILILAALAAVLSATTARAQSYRAHGTAVHAAVVVAPVVPHVSYSNPYWWDQVVLGIYYGGPYGSPSPYPYPYPYHYHGDADGSLKIEVKPRQAEVYVDGYYAGIVDNFDGTFQRLHAAPGEHEISLFLDGYRAVHQKIYLQPNVTFKLKYQMEKLGAGEQ